MEVRKGYKQTEVGVIPNEWDVRSLGRFVALQRGHDLTEHDRRQGEVPVMGSAGPSGFHDIALVRGPGVVLGRSGASFGQAHYCKTAFWPHNTALYVTDFFGNHPLFAFYFLKGIDFSRYNSGGAQPSLNRNFVAPILVAVPKREEQESIAEALSDADALIESVEQLLAKKRQLKQGAMQELLTGNKRLPGFSGEWELRALGEIATANKGSQLSSSEMTEHGRFAHLNGGISASGYTNKSNALGDTIAISEGGNSCGFVQFMSEPYWCGSHCYSVIPNRVDNRFLYHALKAQEPSITGLRVGSGLPNVQKTALLAFKLRCPKASEEQCAIAAILSDMDAEIAALEEKLVKARQVKQGMMQELLTGKIRLV